VGAGPECRWGCVEDIQSCVALVHCVGVSCGVGSSASRCIRTHRIYIYIYISPSVGACFFLCCGNG